MPQVTITNRTRNRLSLPGSPPFTVTDRQERGASLVDTILNPFQARTINVAHDELERVQFLLAEQIRVGTIHLSVRPHIQGVPRGIEPATNERASTNDIFPVPAGPAASLIGGPLAANFDQAPVVAPGAMDVPRNVDVVFSGTWDGGNIEVTGTLTDGTSHTETYQDPGGAGTVVGISGFASVQRARNIGVRTAGTVDVVIGAKLALSKRNLTAVLKEVISPPGGPAIDEPVGVVDLASGTVLPTTPLGSGPLTYSIWSV